MASLFGKKGSDSGSEKQQTIKQYLNKEISLNIKKLQKDHISSASAIRSGETVNRICSCLEAIFLHDIKDSYTSKTFWPFVTKFTHRDVIDQIKQLLFIRTEIGQCRAWIRMAVNDCLIDSYFSAILREPSTLKQHYKPGAFLRDSELPLITNNFLQGLAVFTFQLSCNSSVLNMWDTALLLLSGAYLSNTANQRSTGPEKGRDTMESTLRPDSSSGVDARSDNNIISSFHESEISASLLNEDVDTSPSSHRRDEERSKGDETDQPQLTDKILQVEEYEDSIVIHIESPTAADKASATEEQTVRETSGDVSDTPSIPDPNVNQIRNETGHEIEDNLPDDVSNPFCSGYSEQDKGPLVFSRAADKKAKKKKAKKGQSSVAPLQEKCLPRTDVVEKESKKDIERTEGHEEETVDEEETRDTSAGEGDIYRFDSRSSLKRLVNRDNKVEWVERTIEEEGSRQAAHTIPEEDETTGMAVTTGGNSEEQAHDNDNRISTDPMEENENHQVVGEEKLSDLFGNGLIGMQGWSSDFNQFTSPKPTSLTDHQESYSTMVGNYIDNSAQGIKGLESSQRSEGHQITAEDKEIEEQMVITSPDVIEDYEVIPITNGPHSKYADDRTQALLDMVTKIGLEKGLAAQKFQCRGCSCELGIIFGKHKVCNYDGYYYCSECHLDEQAVIPARILYNWDFRKHLVSCHTKLFLNQVEDMALIDVGKCNPSLYGAISEMEQILGLRKQILYLKAYLFTCKQSVAEELRTKIWPREYMLENCHLYSVRDLLQVQNGNLGPQLKKIIVFAARHVQQCALCSQKGFICEICENRKIIYPFDTDFTIRCDKCRSVFHKACKTDIKPCPRCLRRKLRSPTDKENDDHTLFPSPFT